MGSLYSKCGNHSPKMICGYTNLVVYEKSEARCNSLAFSYDLFFGKSISDYSSPVKMKRLYSFLWSSIHVISSYISIS